MLHDAARDPEYADPAATVVLVREASDGFETLMLRRSSKLSFAGGAWVFPGGRIDPADFESGKESTNPEPLFRAARRAGVRETMEEAGLLVDVDALVWFSHWTPGPTAPRRFSTWFFIAPAPDGRVVVDNAEIHEHVWIRPEEAIRRRDLGEIELIVPTWMTLFRLSHFDTAADAIADAAAHEPEVFFSNVVTFDGGKATLWAGDAGYDDGDVDRPGPRNRLVMLDDDAWRLERTVSA